MLSSTGRQYMLIAPMMALIPGLALTIVVYGINVFGDAMRDLLDPRLRGGGGSYSIKRKEGDQRSRSIRNLFSGERGTGK
jgi:peptide/nickel transport system permease protein